MQKKWVPIAEYTFSMVATSLPLTSSFPFPPSIGGSFTCLWDLQANLQINAKTDSIIKHKLCAYTMNRENQPLVTDEPIELEKLNETAGKILISFEKSTEYIDLELLKKTLNDRNTAIGQLLWFLMIGFYVFFFLTERFGETCCIIDVGRGKHAGAGKLQVS